MNLPVDYTQLTPEGRREVRNQYVTQQQGKCFYCKELLDEPVPQHIRKKKINWSLFPDNFLKYPVHLQHSHESNLTEGAVHSYCNAVMWQYEGR